MILKLTLRRNKEISFYDIIGKLSDAAFATVVDDAYSQDAKRLLFGTKRERLSFRASSCRHDQYEIYPVSAQSRLFNLERERRFGSQKREDAELMNAWQTIPLGASEILPSRRETRVRPRRGNVVISVGRCRLRSSCSLEVSHCLGSFGDEIV